MMLTLFVCLLVAHWRATLFVWLAVEVISQGNHGLSRWRFSRNRLCRAVGFNLRYLNRFSGLGGLAGRLLLFGYLGSLFGFCLTSGLARGIGGHCSVDRALKLGQFSLNNAPTLGRDCQLVAVWLDATNDLPLSNPHG